MPTRRTIDPTPAFIVTERDARLAAVRREIDRLDIELLDLLSRRAGAVAEVAAIKQGDSTPRYYRPEREATLLRRLASGNRGPLPNAEVVRLFREIVSTCRSIEQRLTVACVSVASACAAIGHFGGAIDLHVAPNAAQSIVGVASGRCDHAVVGFSQDGEAEPALIDLPVRGLALCGEWCGRDGRRFVVVGRGHVPPTGDDLTTFVAGRRQAAAIESWCTATNLPVRWTPVAGQASMIVDVCTHMDESQLLPLLDACDGVVLGAYPNVRGGT